ncbi:MAG: TetR/AcrR family transcriptional regulator [Pseudonocardiaceae bacterium]
MARVSQAHLDARRRQILDGARRCFTRNGFHATSMQDILTEADLSAGAVYRYFRGKEDLIEAVAADAVADLRASFESALHETPLRPLEVVVSEVMAQVLDGSHPGEETHDPRAFAKLTLQVWGETLRNESLARTLREEYTGVMKVWCELVRRYQDAGHLRADAPAADITRTLLAVCQGHITQQALFGGISSQSLRDGLRALLTSRPET